MRQASGAGGHGPGWPLPHRRRGRRRGERRTSV